MVTRNERNAIIQHGTMTMVRRGCSNEVSGWGEWCITEDAELGLSIFEAGYGASYTARSYGRGLMPDTFLDYKKQRFRWAYGAVQILLRHAGFAHRGATAARSTARAALSLHRRLAALARRRLQPAVQRSRALFWSVAMIVAPRAVDPP
jgi:cellulose synthase/poly-beta-1,6-N-acetylglucosamine synthase-like glycosyltransferase